MKLKNTHLASLICVSLLGSAALSQAEIIIADDFSYGDGGLNMQSGGTGWGSNVWFAASASVSGGVAQGSQGGWDQAQKRNFANTLGDSATANSTNILWVRFDWGHSAQVGAGSGYGGLTFYTGTADGGSENFLFGNPWSSTAIDGEWNISGGSGDQNTGISSDGMKSGLAKFDLTAGTVSLWVRAPGTEINVTDPADASVSGLSLGGIQGIRILGYNGSASQSFDNLTIATTLAEVNATDVPPSTPASGTWTNAAGGLWEMGTPGNWLDNIVATGSGSTAFFNTLDITADTTVDLNSARPISNLVFGDMDTASAAGWTLANNGNAGNTLNLVGTTPTITVNALGGAKTVTISAAVAGSSGLAKSGPGTLILSAANSYSGPTTVSEGTLLVSGQRYFNVGRTTTVASGAVLELNDSNNTFTSLMPVSSITGAGTFRLSGNSTINQELNGTVSNQLTFGMDAGGLIDLQGTSKLTNGGWKQMNWTTNNASLNIASGATFDIWDGLEVRIDALTGSGTVVKGHPDPNTFMLTLGVANGSGTFSGSIQNTSGAGAIALTKTGSGSQTLSGTNSYNGNTTVEDGTLSIPSGGSLRFFPTTGGQTNALSGSATATLSYLGTVNLDLSAAETIDGNSWTIVNVGSFSVAPTFNPAAVTSTLGSFSETIPGTWELSTAGAKWTFTEDDGTLTCEVTATPYELWANSFTPPIGLPAEDDDNDGVTNFEEYAFGLTPDSGASVNPIATPLKTDGTFSYTRRTDSGLGYSVWFSTTLESGSWTEDTGAVEGHSRHERRQRNRPSHPLGPSRKSPARQTLHPSPRRLKSSPEPKTNPKKQLPNMKRKNTPLTALTCASLLGSAALSQGAVIIAEDFSYADGGLSGAGVVEPGVFNGGFSQAWQTTDLTVSTGVATGNAAARRDFIGNEFGNTGTIWLSFDWGYASTPTQNGSYGGLTFYTNGAENFLIGNPWPGTAENPTGHDVWSMNGSALSNVSNVGMKTAVARIQLGIAATSIVDLWVGATGSPVDVSGPALLTSTGNNLDGVNGIRINGGDFSNGASESIDNIVIGTTIADIDAIPEPSAALLGGLGMLALLRRKR